MFSFNHLAQRSVVALLFVVAGSAAHGASSNDSRVVTAAKNADRESVRRLIKLHADVNTPDVDGTTALHWAAQLNDSELTALLIRAGANVKAANRYGVTPLSLACTNGNADIVEKLLTAGADANSALPEGETALMTAARTGNVQAVKMLLGHDANVNAKENWHGETALMWAAAENHSDVVQALIDRGADVHAHSIIAGYTPSNEGYTPSTYLPVGSFTPLLFAVREGHLECVRVLLAAGADANETVPNGATALTIAILNGHFEVGALLVEKGANANVSQQGWTPLHQLIWARNPNRHFNLPPALPTGNLDSLEFAKFLLAHGADPNARMTKEPADGFRNWMNRIGATPYILAAKASDPALMRLLVDHGADPKLVSKDNTTAVMAAAGVGFWPAESPGTEGESLEAVKLAVELGGDVNAVNDGGYTAMHGAAVHGSNSVVKFLYDKGASLDVKTKKEGWTPVAIADGVFIANTYKATPVTAAFIRQLTGEAKADTK
jgi:ankyrin repeat protein